MQYKFAVIFGTLGISKQEKGILKVSRNKSRKFPKQCECKGAPEGHFSTSTEGTSLKYTKESIKNLPGYDSVR